MSDKTLAELEREMDIATLEFWQAIEDKEFYEHLYSKAESEMRRTKANYLRAKLSVAGALNARKEPKC